MTRTRWIAWVVLGAAALLPGPSRVLAQELAPRTYINSPVGINFLGAGYVFSSGNLLLDPALPIEDRAVSSFMWKSCPYALEAGRLPKRTVEYAGVDYLLAYWMARRFGLVKAED